MFATQRQPQRSNHLEPLQVDLLSLPDEIISQIFCYACEVNPRDKHWRRRFYPMWLGGMCRAWRQIAWSTSELWTTVVVRTFAYELTMWPSRELLKQWIERAQGRKLDVFFSHSHATWHHSQQVVDLMQLLIEHSEQWNKIEVYGANEFWDDMFRVNSASSIGQSNIRHESSKPPLLPLPNLTSASFNSITGLQTGRIPNLMNAPRLRSIGISRIAVERLSTYAPLSSITHISLTFAGERVYLDDLLRSLPRLQDIKFSNTCVLNKSSLDGLAVHEKLTSTSISVLGTGLRFYQGGRNTSASAEMSRYFFQLTLPSLKKLVVRIPENVFEDTETLPQFFQRSSCILTFLTLEFFTILDRDLINILHPLQSLRELHIVVKSKQINPESGPNSAFFEMLNPLEHPTHLPKLILFSYTGPIVVQLTDLFDPFFVRSRTRVRNGEQKEPRLANISTLKRVSIRTERWRYPMVMCTNHYSTIMQMSREGVLVMLHMDESPWLSR